MTSSPLTLNPWLILPCHELGSPLSRSRLPPSCCGGVDMLDKHRHKTGIKQIHADRGLKSICGALFLPEVVKNDRAKSTTFKCMFTSLAKVR